MSYPRLTAVLGSIVALALIAAPVAAAGQTVVQAASPLARQATPEGATPASDPDRIHRRARALRPAGRGSAREGRLDPRQPPPTATS